MNDSEISDALLSNKSQVVGEFLDKRTKDPSLDKDCSLARIFEEIKCKNVPLQEEIEYMVAQKLVEDRFFMTKSKTMKDTVLSLENALVRIKLIKENSEFIIDRYYNNDIDEEFAVRVRMIIQHMMILKKYLKTTFGKLPWEEMEFCLLVMLISFSEQNEQTNIYKLVLDKKRVLRYLETFTTILSTTSESFRKNDINSKLRLQSRDTLLGAVISNTPAFKSLYSDFEIVRDIYSLQKICHYIQETLKADHLENKELEKLIIQRTLQVIGEYLKNAGESPNVSNHVHEILIKSAPPGLKDIITTLRDSLSHAHSLIERFNIEKNQNEFFIKLRNDLKTIHSEIRIVLNERKIKAFLAFSNKMIQCSCLEEAKCFLSNVTLQNAVFHEIPEEDSNVTEVVKVEKMIAEIREEIVDATKHEMMLFEKISELIAMQKQKVSKSEVTLKKLLTFFNKIIYDMKNTNDLNHTKKIFSNVHKVVKTFRKKATNHFRAIAYYLNEIQKNLLSRKLISEMKHVDDLINHAMITLEIESDSVKKIHDFKIDLDTDDDIAENNSGTEVDEIIESILACCTSEDWKNRIVSGYENKKLIPGVKSELYAILKGIKQNEFYVIDEQKISEWKELVKQLDTKKQTEDSLISHYENKNIKGCENLLNLITDTYTALQKSFKVHNIFINDKQISAVKGFLDSLKFKKNEVENIMNEFIKYAESKTKNYYSTRLALLKTILYIENQQNIGDTIKKYNTDRTFQITIEALMLDLLEILEDMSYFTDNRLFIDDFAPLMVGKALRNYMAHGNAFLDILPYKPSLSLLCNAFKLVELGEDLLNMRNVIIGNIKTCSDEHLQSHQEKILSYIKIQSDLLSYASTNDIGNMKDSINNGANIFGKTLQGYTVLHCSAKTNSVEAFEFALEEYSTVNFMNHDRIKVLHKCLHLASIHGSDRIIDYYLEQGFDLSHCPDGTSIIHILAKYGHIEIIKKLTSKNLYDLNVLSTTPEITPLHVASEYNQIDVLKFLLSSCNVKATTSCIWNPLHLASRNGHEHIAKLLIEHADEPEKYINETTSTGFTTPLHLAAENGHENIVLLLTKYNADPCIGNGEHSTPLESSARNDHLNVFKILFDYTLNRNNKANDKMPDVANWKELIAEVLASVCYYGHTSILNFLLGKGFDVNQTFAEGNNLLHASSEGNHRKMVQILISAGINVDLMNTNGLTPLHLASSHGNIEIVQDLLSAGAKINALDQHGLTALCMACLSGYADIAEKLLKDGADINLTSIKKITPLHAAVYSGTLDLVNILIENGAEVNAKTHKGITPLHVAAYAGFDNIIGSLLKNNAAIDIGNDNHYTALHLACRDGHNAVVKTLVNNHANVDAATVKVKGDRKEFWQPSHMWSDGGIILNIRGLTPMHLAAQNGYLDLVSLLIGKKAKFDVSDENGVTPLVLAVQNGHTKIVHLLISNGADVNVLLKDNLTPLLCAAQGDHKKTAVLLLKSGASINDFNIHNYTALHFACLYGYVTLVAALIEHGAQLEMRTGDGSSSLHLAVLSGSIEVVQHLVKNGAKVDAENYDGVTPLAMAVFLKNRELVRALCEAGAEVNHKTLSTADGNTNCDVNDEIDVTNKTLLKISSMRNEMREMSDTHSPLLIAATQDSYHIVCDLLSYGADPNFAASDNPCGLPIHFACLRGNADVVKALLGSGADIEARSSELFTPLLAAIQGNHLHVVSMLLEAGADVNIANIEGGTPLLMAIQICDVEIVTLLLEYGADVNQPLHDTSPLYLACRLSYYDKVAVLLENKADVHMATMQNWSPLHVAASNVDSREIVSLLLNYNADIEFTSVEGLKPLHLAAQNGCFRVVEELLSRGAETDVAAEDGATPLYLASYYGHFDVVDSLLINKADVELATENKMTPLHVAIIKRYPSIVRRLLRARPDVNFKNIQGRTPLHLAILVFSMEIVCDLLINGAIIDDYSEYLMRMHQVKFNRSIPGI